LGVAVHVADHDHDHVDVDDHDVTSIAAMRDVGMRHAPPAPPHARVRHRNGRFPRNR
jgi:hypothetical protein